MKEKNNKASPILAQTFPWADNPNPIWFASTIKFYRNVNKYLFPGKLDAVRQKQLATMLGKALTSCTQFKTLNLFNAEELAPIEKEFLFEHFLAHDGFHQAHSGEGFALDDSGEFIAVFNVTDHLQIQLTDCRGELESTWNKLVKIESEIGKMVDYAFSSRFGFLTSNPAHCGTGMSVYIYLHLPAIIHTDKLFEVLEKYHDEMVEAAGIQGKIDDIVGDIIVLNNRYCLGVSEEDIMRSLRTISTKLVTEEKGIRSHINEEKHPALKNKVSRAYALACHSYQLETVEALNIISLCKLALDIGWLTGIEHKTLNALLFKCRRAHLLTQLGTKADTEETPTKRAELLHQALKSATLHI